MTPSTRKTADWILLACALAAYAAVTAWLAAHHEPWRDEWERLTLAARSTSLLDVLAQSRHNLHPFLWHLVLYGLWQVFHHPLVMQAAALGAALGAAWIWLRYSPLGWPVRLLFLAGYFPLYEYSVVAANYGISMTLLFVFCAWYPSRFERPLRIGLVLALLANTNLHSAAISACLAGLLGWEWLRRPVPGGRHRASWALCLAAAGLAWSVLSTYPTPDYLSPRWQWDPSLSMARQAVRAVFVPGRFFPTGLGVTGDETLRCLIVWSWTAYLVWRRKVLGAVYWAAMTSLAMIFALVYPGAPRHQGFVLLAFVALAWIAGLPAGRKQRLAATLFLAASLALQIPPALRAAGEEIARPYSNLVHLARLIRDDPRCRDAILLGEPDYAVVQIGWYADIPVYLSREGRYGRVVSLKQDNRSQASLEDLLDDALRLRRETGRPVVIALGAEINLRAGRKTSLFFHSYDKSFILEPRAVERFLGETVRIARLDGAVTDENYEVYLLEKPAG